MLEEREYGFEEIKAIMGCPDKQGIDRKLRGYGISFESRGRGKNRIYTIQHISDPFKVYCILKLGIPAQSDFLKILHLYYYFFNCDAFASAPAIEQEKMMEEDGRPVSRKTITKWITYLETINYIMFDRNNCWYYVISRGPNEQKIYTETDKETYNKGWRIYFKYKDEEGCGPAYSRMYNFIGGHPYKKQKFEENGIMKSDVLELTNLITETYLTKYKNQSPLAGALIFIYFKLNTSHNIVLNNIVGNVLLKWSILLKMRFNTFIYSIRVERKEETQ